MVRQKRVEQRTPPYRYRLLSEVDTEEASKYMKISFMVKPGWINSNCRLFNIEYTLHEISEQCSHKTKLQ